MPDGEKSVLLKLGMKLSPAGKRTLTDMHKRLGRLQKSAGRAMNFAKHMAVGGAVAFTGFLVKGVRDAREFGKAMAEVSTIVDTSTVNMGGLRKQVLSLSVDTGKGPAELAKGLYQTISAGIDAGNAMEFLRKSTQAAIGGVAEVSEAVDLGTNVLNAYGMSARETTRVFDIAFASVKEGKTTFSELASTMGGVLPVAAQLDIELESLFAATATLTKGGIDTANAVTYLRGVLTSVLKPGNEAKELAKKLKINFSAAGLKALGFAGFLEELKRKTGGSAEALAKLFPNVRGLTAVLALSGAQAKEFTRILEELRSSGGAAGAAFNKIASSEFMLFDKALNKLKIVGIALGEKVLPSITKAIAIMTPALVAAVELLSGLLEGAESLATSSGWTGVKKFWTEQSLRLVAPQLSEKERRAVANRLNPATSREVGEGMASSTGGRYYEFKSRLDRADLGMPGHDDSAVFGRGAKALDEMVMAGTGMEGMLAGQGRDMATVVVNAQQAAVRTVTGQMKDALRRRKAYEGFVAAAAYQ